ncbi:MAG: CocE/NonD family hydrolase, partial [Thauera sp.]
MMKEQAIPEEVQVLSRQAIPLSSAPRYPGLEERAYVLPRGYRHFSGAMPLVCDVLVEQDVAVTLRDGIVIRVDVFRPVDRTDCPAIVAWSPYGKRGGLLTNDFFGHPTRMDVPVCWEDGLNKFEGPNPSYWVAHGYAVIAPDPRGCFNSEGDIRAWGKGEAEDEYDLIEWVASRPWSNGKVGLSGNSWLAMTQWSVAALRPPHLAAIAPWEGAHDIYRETMARGGIPDTVFPAGIFACLPGKGRIEDPVAMVSAHPRFDQYWASKVADLSSIDVPAYVVASWTNLLHTTGSIAGWRGIHSKQKWLRVHNTHEWTDYYSPDSVEDLRRFFDRFLKGIDNDWEATPAVRLSILDPGRRDTVGRAESDFPLARQKFVPFHLSIGEQCGQLASVPQQHEVSCTYDSSDLRGATFRVTFDREIEVTGYLKLKLWVEALD